VRTAPVLACTTALAIALATAAPGHLSAQASSAAAVDPNLAFEAASVKANKSGEPFIRFGGASPGRFNAVNAPVREIIRVAYNVQPFQLVGLPAWTETERFDITAKVPPDAPPLGPPGTPGAQSPIAVMLQNLLTERFKLKAHREQREMPIYALMLARPDGKLGAALKPSPVSCEELRNQARAAARAGGPPPLPTPPKPGEAPQCGLMMSPVSIMGGGVTISNLATALGQRLGRSVVDKTGLTGEYQFVINFTPDQLPPGGTAPPGQPPLINGAQFDPNGPSLVTAIQEQLGLKLEPQRGQVDVVVIDSIDRPVED
jgi:uncharacterized protein (TIGR03435 family)